MTIIGRKSEIQELESRYDSGRPEFIAVYGRRRVGKTFLIDELFANRTTFRHTGLSPYGRQKKNLLSDQLKHFHRSLLDQGADCPVPKSWLEAVYSLQQWLETCDNGSRQVVFLDELPWMDTARSNFITALEAFWNNWGVRRKNLMLIVCGSSTSWIEDKLINGKGGLYDRLTDSIHLQPFSLAESEAFFESRDIRMSRYDIIQSYMVFGGIPYYLGYFDKGWSLSQNIDRILFSNNAKLKGEFDRLFGSLFNNPEEYKEVVAFLSRRRSGYTRQEMTEAGILKDGGGATKLLESLSASGFITPYIPFGKGKRERFYRLSDPFCIFHLYFFKEFAAGDPAFWQNQTGSHRLDTWRGLAFENVCLSHIEQIKRALGVSGVFSQHYPLLIRNEKKAVAQIDMILDRADNVVNLCELKFHSAPFTITKSDDLIFRGRIEALASQLPARKTIHFTMISSFGIVNNPYSGIVQKELTMDSLFE